LIHFNGTTANHENKKDGCTEELNFCHSLFRCERTDKIDEVPTIGIRKCGFEGGHARGRKAVRDPFVQLRIGMNAGDGMLGQIGRARVERYANGTIPFAARSMTRSAGCHERRLTCYNRLLVGGNRIGLFVEHLNRARQVKDANSNSFANQFILSFYKTITEIFLI